jgi:sphingosine kinase
MQDAVRLADMNGATKMGASEAIGMRLGLGGNKTLTIGDKDLVLFGTHDEQDHRHHSDQYRMGQLTDNDSLNRPRRQEP